MAAPSPSTTIAVLNASTGTTTLVLVVVLVVLGLAMVLTAVWLVRTTRSDSPALAPLEVMGARRWRRADANRRVALLAVARPTGAPDPAPMVPYGDEPTPEPTPEPEQVDTEPEPMRDEQPNLVDNEREAEPPAQVEEQPVATPESS